MRGIRAPPQVVTPIRVYTTFIFYLSRKETYLKGSGCVSSSAYWYRHERRHYLPSQEVTDMVVCMRRPFSTRTNAHFKVKGRERINLGGDEKNMKDIKSHDAVRKINERAKRISSAVYTQLLGDDGPQRELSVNALLYLRWIRYLLVFFSDPLSQDLYRGWKAFGGPDGHLAHQNDFSTVFYFPLPRDNKNNRAAAEKHTRISSSSFSPSSAAGFIFRQYVNNVTEAASARSFDSLSSDETDSNWCLLELLEARAEQKIRQSFVTPSWTSVEAECDNEGGDHRSPMRRKEYSSFAYTPSTPPCDDDITVRYGIANNKNKNSLSRYVRETVQERRTFFWVLSHFLEKQRAECTVSLSSSSVVATHSLDRHPFSRSLLWERLIGSASLASLSPDLVPLVIRDYYYDLSCSYPRRNLRRNMWTSPSSSPLPPSLIRAGVVGLAASQAHVSAIYWYTVAMFACGTVNNPSVSIEDENPIGEHVKSNKPYWVSPSCALYQMLQPRRPFSFEAVVRLVASRRRHGYRDAWALVQSIPLQALREEVKGLYRMEGHSSYGPPEQPGHSLSSRVPVLYIYGALSAARHYYAGTQKIQHQSSMPASSAMSQLSIESEVSTGEPQAWLENICYGCPPFFVWGSDGRTNVSRGTTAERWNSVRILPMPEVVWSTYLAVCHPDKYDTIGWSERLDTLGKHQLVASTVNDNVAAANHVYPTERGAYDHPSSTTGRWMGIMRRAGRPKEILRFFFSSILSHTSSLGKGEHSLCGAGVHQVAWEIHQNRVTTHSSPKKSECVLLHVPEDCLRMLDVNSTVVAECSSVEHAKDNQGGTEVSFPMTVVQVVVSPLSWMMFPHASVFNHTLAALTEVGAWSSALALYEGLVQWQKSNFYTHLTVLKMFLSPVVFPVSKREMLALSEKRHQHEEEGEEDSPNSLSRESSFYPYTRDALNHCHAALRRCYAAPPPSHKWMRTGRILEDRLVLWAVTASVTRQKNSLASVLLSQHETQSRTVMKGEEKAVQDGVCVGDVIRSCTVTLNTILLELVYVVAGNHQHSELSDPSSKTNNSVAGRPEYCWREIAQVIQKLIEFIVKHPAEMGQEEDGMNASRHVLCLALAVLVTTKGTEKREHIDAQPKEIENQRVSLFVNDTNPSSVDELIFQHVLPVLRECVDGSQARFDDMIDLLLGYFTRIHFDNTARRNSPSFLRFMKWFTNSTMKPNPINSTGARHQEVLRHQRVILDAAVVLLHATSQPLTAVHEKRTWKLWYEVISTLSRDPHGSKSLKLSHAASLIVSSGCDAIYALPFLSS